MHRLVTELDNNYLYVLYRVKNPQMAVVAEDLTS